jgi:transcriptional regulator with GAF, ATPase, and Fis domain
MTIESAALGAIVGADPGLRNVIARARLVGPTRTPVLVTGESGTGKELLARALHELGPEPGGPFVTVNCGALPRELAESELFGHERGAFTGAAGRRAGWFEEASGGTLVLDEIGELPPELQPKLLRVLETGRIRRVGGNGEAAVRVRVVAMTLRELGRDGQRGAFRLDLYHRLAGFELALPPLRRRRGDIPALVQRFLEEFRPELGPRVLDPAALARLQEHDWPGNVRSTLPVPASCAWPRTPPKRPSRSRLAPEPTATISSAWEERPSTTWRRRSSAGPCAGPAAAAAARPTSSASPGPRSAIE